MDNNYQLTLLANTDELAMSAPLKTEFAEEINQLKSQP